MKQSNKLYRQALRDFQKWLNRVRASHLPEPTAMSLATADSKGFPTVRMVLLKGIDEDGFVFYTNAESRKGRQLLQNPRAALCFYWFPIHRQILVEGSVKPVTDKEADDYWATRPRVSQIGAWASSQSRPLKDYRRLLARVRIVREKFKGKPIPRPPYWNGFRVVPRRIEFWRARPYRLHERIEFKKVNGEWVRGFLFP